MMYFFLMSISDDVWLEEIVNEICENVVDLGIVDMFWMIWLYVMFD